MKKRIFLVALSLTAILAKTQDQPPALIADRPDKAESATVVPIGSMILAFSNSLSDQFSLGYNPGSEWNGETRGPSYTYSVSPGISLAMKLEFS